MDVKELSCQYKDDIIRWRRTIHANPEIAWHEVETSRFIAAELDKMGIGYVFVGGGKGVLATLEGARPGRTVALRADIDALPLQELTDVPYKSKNNGCMHACGHDGHAAALLGAAKILSQLKCDIVGTVKFIFQPAEEGGFGSSKLIEEGILDGVDGIFALHVSPSIPTGNISIEAGPRMASGDKFTITVHGKTGHGALPHQGIDAILAASAIVTNLQSINSREVNPAEPVVITICKITGGSRWNFICNEVVMEGTTRCFNPDIRNRFEMMMGRIIECTAESFRATAELDYEYVAPATINDRHIACIAQKAVSELYGNKVFATVPQSMTGEDFAYMLERVPGAIALLGVGNPEKGCNHPLHDNLFNMDEDALPIGSAMHAQFVLDFLSD